MNARYEIVMDGVPVSSRRGALGWCSVVLVRAGATKILFDTGSYGDRPLLLSRLAALGVGPAEVDLVFASHFHFDHVANAELFDCPVMVSAAERSHVESQGYLEAGDPYVPRALAPWLGRRLVAAQGGDEIAPGVEVVLLPGHTVGTAGLLLREDRVLLAADAVKSVREFVRDEPPPCFWSREAARENYRRVRDIATTVVPGHDRPFTLAGDGSVRRNGGEPIMLEVYSEPAADPRVIVVRGSEP